MASSASPLSTAGPTSGRMRRSFVTPEGVDLRLELATAGQRAAAFLLDGAIIIGTLIGFTILLALTAIGSAMGGAGESGITVTAIIWLLLFFLLRNFYFVAFELGTRAATPGKRALGLRVVARDGGRLTADAVIARNLVREIEIYLPLSFLAFEAGTGTPEAWTVVAGLIWSGVFTFFPLFNRDRLRAGDLLAGTWVVHAPRSGAGADLAGAAPAQPFAFSAEQLGVYGVYELQTLEEVLRRSEPAAIATAAASIRRKIDWTGTEPDADFLGAYYTALCARLENRLLYGKRRASKHEPLR